ADLTGSVTFLQLDASLGLPTALTVSTTGNIYVTDIEGDRVWELSPAKAAPLSAVELVNAASLRPGPIAPGMLVTLRGVKLRAPEIVFGKIIADVLSLKDSEMILRVPEDLRSGLLEIDVRDNLVSQFHLTVQVAAASPALFTDAEGHAVVVNEDGSLNSVDKPAARGAIIVLFGTGQGVGDLPVSLRIGTYAAEVLYSGPVEAYPGLWQINARVPAGYLAPGKLPVTVAVGDAVSASVTLDVL
ncbi:MAG: hypothetical protein ABI995_10155, partial [Acidobacteriota bacterium]